MEAKVTNAAFLPPAPGGTLARSPDGSQSGYCSMRRTQEGPSWCEKVRPRKVGTLLLATGNGVFCGFFELGIVE